MSGQPSLNPSDPLKFREQYLANLALRIKLDDKNLQANKIYKRTGQTPTIVLDTRTTTEKLADLQRLGVELRAELKSIMDGPTAEKVIRELDPESLQFLAQHITDIIIQLKPKYKYGVPFITFMTFFTAYYRSSVDSNDYIAGLQQKVGKDILLGINQILANMVDKDLLEMVLAEIDIGADRRNEALAVAIRRDIEELERSLINRTEYNAFISQGNQQVNMELFARINDAVQELPTRTQMNEFLREYDRAVNLRDAETQRRLLEKLKDVLTVPPEVLEQLQAVKNEIGALRQEGVEQTRVITDELNERRKEEASIKALSATLSPEDKATLLDLKQDMVGLATQARRRQYIKSMIDMDIVRGGQTRASIYTTLTGKKALENLNQDEEQVVIAEINKRIDILTSPYPMPRNLIQTPVKQGQPAEEPFFRPDPTGSGLRRGRPIGSGRKKGSGVKGNGIQKDPNVEGIERNPNRYATFGKFHINTHKLNDNIISLKRNTGCNVADLPVRRVSNELGNVIRTIVGGGHPEFRHLDKLCDEEKVFLSKIAKKSSIEDRLNVPTPSKDDDEKDIHQFEVMKGQIMAGNDNMDMVKKFKLLIMKLSRKDLLPRNQAKDIMMDLATLGY